MSIKPLDSLTFLREGQIQKCKVVTVDEVGYLVTYQVDGKSKLKPLKFDQILSHKSQNSRNRRWLIFVLAFCTILIAVLGFHYTNVSI